MRGFCCGGDIAAFLAMLPDFSGRPARYLRTMGQKKRLPDYSTIIGEGTEVNGAIRFCGGMHVDGRVFGDVSASSGDGCALSLSQSGVIQGNLDVAHVVLDGVVIGDVRAAERATLAPGARIEGDLYYGALEMAEGAEVNGKLFRIDEARSS